MIQGTLLSAVSVLSLLAGGMTEPRLLLEEIGEIKAIEIEGFEGQREQPRGYLGKGACADFALDLDKAKFFFEHAVVISGYSMENEYPWFNCRITGKVVAGAREYSWEISPAGTGTLVATDDDRVPVNAVCDKGCREVFPHGGRMQQD